jgi:malonate-semialdehyde dehydrogenase (acetylating)/methylmalonate-semialdehyde dehydrogenase
MVEILKHYINGQFISSKSTVLFDVMNPATNEILAKSPNGTPEEVLMVVEAASKAFPKWRDTPVVDRIQPLLKLQAILKEKIDILADACTINHGKERSASVGEVIRAYQMIEASLAVPEMQKGEFMEDIATGIDEYSVRVPLGVFAMIPPFNFPVMIPFWFFPWAVAAGNSYIIKSNEQTPLCLQRIFELIDKCGFPPGVMNLIHGNVEVANGLIDHPKVVGISSVGSTPVAKTIYRRATNLGKRAQCHGGANNFLIIMPDANIDKIMPNIMNSVFGNSGQRCLAGKKLVVVGNEKFYAYFKEKLLIASKAIKVGYGMDKDTFMGPVVSKNSLKKLIADIEKGIQEGAKIILDGRNIKVTGFENGYFLGPTIFENVRPSMYVYKEEIFGPVISLLHVDTLDNAILLLNYDPRGNATTIYTESGENARYFRKNVTAGNIGINLGVVAPLAYFPFAGAKESFFGTIRAQGREALEFFTQSHVIIERFHGSTKIEWD